jgi:excisionase family DNA binding protein
MVFYSSICDLVHIPDPFIMTQIKLLTVKEVAKLLKLNSLTVYDYIKGGKLEAVKIGRNYRVEERQLSSFIKSHKVKKGTSQ